jgi:hypothetical protein
MYTLIGVPLVGVRVGRPACELPAAAWHRTEEVEVSHLPPRDGSYRDGGVRDRDDEQILARHRVSPGRLALATVLLVAPFVALMWVPSYAKASPKLLDFPFFYWYQLLWVFIAAGLTYTAYLVIGRGRDESAARVRREEHEARTRGGQNR